MTRINTISSAFIKKRHACSAATIRQTSESIVWPQPCIIAESLYTWRVPGNPIKIKWQHCRKYEMHTNICELRSESESQSKKNNRETDGPKLCMIG